MCIPPFAIRLQRMGHPDCLSLEHFCFKWVQAHISKSRCGAPASFARCKYLKRNRSKAVRFAQGRLREGPLYSSSRSGAQSPGSPSLRLPWPEGGVSRAAAHDRISPMGAKDRQNEDCSLYQREYPTPSAKCAGGMGYPATDQALIQRLSKAMEAMFSFFTQNSLPAAA